MKKDDLALFLQEVADVKKIDNDDKADTRTIKGPTDAQRARKEAAEASLEDTQDFLSTEYIEPVDPDDLLTYKKDGVQEGVFRKLRLGLYAIESTLFLTQMTIHDVKRELVRFIDDCHKANVRSLLINHGMGKNSKPFPGYLKSCLNKWLPQFDAILAFHTAQKHHGGYGATYVLLRKSERKKQENKERHMKRRG